MIKVADYVINTLAERDIDKAFVVYGAANGDLLMLSLEQIEQNMLL